MVCLNWQQKQVIPIQFFNDMAMTGLKKFVGKVTADYLVERVLKHAAPNGIILMHLGGYQTVEALPIIEGVCTRLPTGYSE